jgi:hypothetical protein
MSGPTRDELVKALSLNPNRSEAYYVLGGLYRELPGWPISFGNVDAAVSFGRKAVEKRREQVDQGVEKELVYDFYTELAKTLYKRNWSADARAAEQKKKLAKLASAITLLDKGSLFEATITLKEVSDREEARLLVKWVVNELQNRPSMTALQQKYLQKAKDVMTAW